MNSTTGSTTKSRVKRKGEILPNNGHYTLCPYYKHEKDKVIYCEDTSRRFLRLEEKENHMVKYCDSAWERCPYAITISHVWEQINSDMEHQQEIYLTHQVKAMKGELKKLNGRLNKLEKFQDIEK